MVNVVALIIEVTIVPKGKAPVPVPVPTMLAPITNVAVFVAVTVVEPVMQFIPVTFTAVLFVAKYVVPDTIIVPSIVKLPAD